MNASCEHFSEYFKEFGPNAFNIINGIFSTCVSQEARRQKVSVQIEHLVILWQNVHDLRIFRIFYIL